MVFCYQKTTQNNAEIFEFPRSSVRSRDHAGSTQLVELRRFRILQTPEVEVVGMFVGMCAFLVF